MKIAELPVNAGYTLLLCLLLSLLVPTANGGEVSPKASCMLHVCLVAWRLIKFESWVPSAGTEPI